MSIYLFLWLPQVLWLHVISDAIIALSYYSIPLTILYFIRKRRDLPFPYLFYLFGAFILFCGTTHLMEIWVIWQPDYPEEGLMKALTAMVSICAAIITWKIVPVALQLRSPAELETMPMRHKISRVKKMV